jgi:hypothetical protein
VSAQPESDVVAPATGGAPAFRRVLPRLSGEALMGGQEYGISRERVESLAVEVKRVQERGVGTALEQLECGYR